MRLTEDDPSQLLLSPCVGVCRIDPATGWCAGCARDDLELAGWRDLDAPARAEIWRDLPRRQAVMGTGYELLPWTGQPLLDRLAGWSAEPGAGWSMGVFGAVAELIPQAGQAPDVIREADGLLVIVPRGIMRLLAHPGLRAFGFADGCGGIGHVVLALHRSRLRGALHGIKPLGADTAAIGPDKPAGLLVDLGLGFAHAAFCVRTNDPGLIAAVLAQAGQSLFRTRPPLVPHLLTASPTRVLISPLGRIEVSGPILGQREGGARTRLLPEQLAKGLKIEPGITLPEAYVPCASFCLPSRVDDCPDPGRRL